MTDATKLVQHRPWMLAVKAAGGAEHDAYLVLSFESAGYTTLLDIRGTSFQEASPPGLALDASTLLLARLPDGRLLQVTPQVLTPPACRSTSVYHRHRLHLSIALKIQRCSDCRRGCPMHA